MKTYTTNTGSILIQLLMDRRCNCFLIDDGKIKVLVDTSRKSDRKKLLQQIAHYYPALSKIDYLVLTHSHYDHVQNAAFLKAKYSPMVIAHQLEADFLEQGKTSLPNGTSWYPKLLVKMAKILLPNLPNYNPLKCEIEINAEYKLSDSIKLLPTPGHTEGSISIIVDNELALVGDTMFGIFRKTIFPPFADKPQELTKSWTKLLHIGCSTFFPSHGQPIQKQRLIEELKKVTILSELLQHNIQK